MLKKCFRCGSEFETVSNRTKYCSKECREYMKSVQSLKANDRYRSKKRATIMAKKYEPKAPVNEEIRRRNMERMGLI